MKITRSRPRHRQGPGGVVHRADVYIDPARGPPSRPARVQANLRPLHAGRGAPRGTRTRLARRSSSPRAVGLCQRRGGRRSRSFRPGDRVFLPRPDEESLARAPAPRAASWLTSRSTRVDRRTRRRPSGATHVTDAEYAAAQELDVDRDVRTGLRPVNGSSLQPPQRCSSRIPASRGHQVQLGRPRVAHLDRARLDLAVLEVVVAAASGPWLTVWS